MINVKYQRIYNKLTVEGHADSAPKGEDLVCSAASILVHTLSANVGNMVNAGIAVNPETDIRDGYAKIRCRAVRGHENTVASIFQAVCVGFEILADKFPDYISFKIMG